MALVFKASLKTCRLGWGRFCSRNRSPRPQCPDLRVQRLRVFFAADPVLEPSCFEGQLRENYWLLRAWLYCYHFDCWSKVRQDFFGLYWRWVHRCWTKLTKAYCIIEPWQQQVLAYCTIRHWAMAPSIDLSQLDSSLLWVGLRYVVIIVISLHPSIHQRF